MSHQNVAILYHSGCPDGFGGAYAAWKKFGKEAEYIPVKHQRPVPEHLEGKELYLVDFCYPKEIMDVLIANSTSVTVLDHHLGIKDVVEQMPHFVFDEKRSGATIAWSYFHPESKVPALLQYVEDGDLYTFKLPESRAILAYIYAQKFQFEEWDKLASELEDASTRSKFIKIGEIYSEHFLILVEQMAKRASLVSFEGHECYLVGANGIFASDIGNFLVGIKPPIGIITHVNGDRLSVSLRSNDTVDVAELAKKYGGGGHPRASGFEIKWGEPLPWKVVDEHENPGH